jgi:hypothetical protein
MSTKNNSGNSRYVQVTVRPYRVRQYPFKAREITFTVCRKNAVQAVEMLMCNMGYGAHQYSIVSSLSKSNATAHVRDRREAEGT